MKASASRSDQREFMRGGAVPLPPPVPLPQGERGRAAPSFPSPLVGEGGARAKRGRVRGRGGPSLRRHPCAAFGEEREQSLARGWTHAAFGDEAGDEAGGRHVEGIVGGGAPL